MRRLPLLLALLLLQALLAPGAAACSPAPTPWFVERATVGVAELPEGVEVSAPDPAHIIIKNTTPQELYLLSEPVGGVEYPQLDTELPEGWAPSHKLTGGKLMHWNNFAWKERPERQLEIDVGHYANFILKDYFFLRFDNRNPHADDRPDDAPLPLPQELQLLLVYDGRLLRVPLMISYEFNPDYSPSSYTCSSLYMIEALFYLGSALLVIIPIVLVLRWRRRRATRARS